MKKSSKSRSKTLSTTDLANAKGGDGYVFVRFREAATKQIQELNTISENIN